MDFNKLKEKGLEYVEKGRLAAADLTEKGRIQTRILTDQAKLIRAQRQLGVLVYSLAKGNEENQPLVDKYIDMIGAIEQEIAQLKAKLTPAEVQEVERAVADVIRSKTFDCGTICASEQSVILHADQAQRMEAELTRQGGCILDEADGKKLAQYLFRANGTMNPAVVGKPAAQIAALAGLSDRAKNAKVLLARETGVGPKNPYSMEKLCPVLGLYQVRDENEALQLSCEILRHEGSGHTFTIHAEEEAVIRRFALEVPVSRFLVNTPASLGGVGLTTGLFPALTLGCGAVGGSSSSNNIGPLDLINLRRVAWGYQTAETGHTTGETDDALIEALTEKLLRRLVHEA